MTFDIDRGPRTSKVSPQQMPERKQVGARIPTMLYRQLKAKASLEGVRVQDMVEQAIRQFLENADR
jgi:hypothetical protein